MSVKAGITRYFRLGVVTLLGNVLSLRNFTGGNASYRLDETAARRWREYLMTHGRARGEYESP